ncbi:porin [Dyella monticola]|uniref:Porin n=1 Tax=Dyella monticola TaxID=1927958 RepID=A0A370WSV6_9GAMM|nr:porin [Dyella monticola]RDS79210.1 porin [Dyella monticola]
MKSVRRTIQYLVGMGVTASANAYDINHWPTQYVAPDGTELSVTGNYQYDAMFAHRTSLIDDAHTHRRKELGVAARSKGKWDAIVYFDFQSKTWLDVFWRMDSQWLFGADYGKFRIGYSKLQVGFEGGTASRAYSFAETSLPMQAFFQNRRTGVDWTLDRPHYLFNVGYYFAGDLQGKNDGTTAVARAAWTPHKSAGDVLHLGISASVEHPHGSRDGLNNYNAPTARWRARPEAPFTNVRLVDSGNLNHLSHHRRLGLEGLWIGGPWSVQGEYLQVTTSRSTGLPSYTADGYYVFGSYLLTGESRQYAAGNVGNPLPAHPWGAWEVLLRYSALNLDQGQVRGGHERDLTLGVNWYLTRHFKLQANYVNAHAIRQGQRYQPTITELRAQVYF